jgi:hypothetical protein
MILDPQWLLLHEIVGVSYVLNAEFESLLNGIPKAT